MKIDILNMKHLVSQLQKSNRTRLAAIIDREWELSSRQHELNTADLEARITVTNYRKLLDGNKGMNEYINDINMRLAAVQRETQMLQEKAKEIDVQMERLGLKDLKRRKEEITMRKIIFANKSNNSESFQNNLNNSNMKRGRFGLLLMI